MALEDKTYYTVDNVAHPTVVWSVQILTGTPGATPYPFLGKVQQLTDILNINTLKPVFVPGNKIVVGTLPTQQQDWLELYSFNNDAANLYLQP